MSKASKIDEATLERNRADVFGSPPSAFVLRVTAGPDRGQAFTLDSGQPPVLAGQSPACGIRLGDREVSRRHASLEALTSRVRVSDLGSTNGTFVEGVAVAEAFVRVGQSVQLGGTTLLVEPAMPSAAAALSPAASFGRMLGRSPEMRRLYPIFERLAASTAPIVIEGETGTGKELLAESLHERSARAAGPFVVLDCGALAAANAEAELFGLDKMKPGVFEQADGGTLFIDDIGDLDLVVQPKLLRVLDRGEIVRVGGNTRVRIDVRVVAATHRDLDHEIQTGRFREDLFHRLAVARVELPPLRKRSGDVELLAMHFARERLGCGLDALLVSRWKDYAWPGNVRELRNAVARRLMLGDLMTTTEAPEETARSATKLLAHYVEEAVAAGTALGPSRQLVINIYDRLYIEAMLAKHGGHVLKAAAEAGVARRYFQLLRAKQAKTP